MKSNFLKEKANHEHDADHKIKQVSVWSLCCFISYTFIATIYVISLPFISKYTVKSGGQKPWLNHNLIDMITFQMKQKANDEAVQCLVEHTQKISAENKLLRKVFLLLYQCRWICWTMSIERLTYYGFLHIVVAEYWGKLCWVERWAVLFQVTIITSSGTVDPDQKISSSDGTQAWTTKSEKGSCQRTSGFKFFFLSFFGRSSAVDLV